MDAGLFSEEICSGLKLAKLPSSSAPDGTRGAAAEERLGASGGAQHHWIGRSGMPTRDERARGEPEGAGRGQPKVHGPEQNGLWSRRFFQEARRRFAAESKMLPIGNIFGSSRYEGSYALFQRRSLAQ